MKRFMMVLLLTMFSGLNAAEGGVDLSQIKVENGITIFPISIENINSMENRDSLMGPFLNEYLNGVDKQFGLEDGKLCYFPCQFKDDNTVYWFQTWRAPEDKIEMRILKIN